MSTLSDQEETSVGHYWEYDPKRVTDPRQKAEFISFGVVGNSSRKIEGYMASSQQTQPQSSMDPTMKMGSHSVQLLCEDEYTMLQTKSRLDAVGKRLPLLSERLEKDIETYKNSLG